MNDPLNDPLNDRLHAIVDGPADHPVLILGTSLGTTCALWEPLVPALANHFRVVRYDHLGHGGSAVPEGPYTIERLGRATLGLLDRLGLGTVSYAGLSLGGMVGMWLAINAPERIDRLALLCTAARLPAEPWQDRVAAVRLGGLRAIADPVLARWFTPGWAASHPDVVQAFRAGLESTPQDGYVGCCEAIAAMDLRPELPGIAAPSVVIGGAQDAAIPVDYQVEIAEAMPGARLVVVDGAAHLAPVEQTEIVTATLVDHLSPRGSQTGG
jgi:3-oxoadipate enol-lactonase